MSDFLFIKSNTIPEPLKYKAKRAIVKSNCVIGSVDGVIIAAIIVDETTTYFQAESIILRRYLKARTTCKTGTWNANPVVKINTAINQNIGQRTKKVRLLLTHKK